MTDIVETKEEMPVSVSEDNVARLNVLVNENELEPYKKHFIKEKAKTAVIRGFRKGAAPENMIAKFFKEEAHQFARDNMVFNKYTKLLQEHRLQPLSDPKLVGIIEENGVITANMMVDVLQPVMLGQYLGLEIEKAPEKNVEEELNKTLIEIKNKYPKLVECPIDNLVQDNNFITADYVVSDKEIILEEQKDFKMHIGAKLYFKDFEDCIVGMGIGTKEFDVTFPETYHREEFRSKSIHFNFTVKNIYTIAEYNNEELSIVLNYTDEKNMIDGISTEIVKKNKQEDNVFYENQILEKLLTSHNFKLPRRLVIEEASRIKKDNKDMSEEEIIETANRFVKTDLIMHAILEKHPDIALTQEMFNLKITELAAKANDTVENTIQKLQNAGKMNAYSGYLNNCQVINYLIEMSDIKKKEEMTNG